MSIFIFLITYGPLALSAIVGLLTFLIFVFTVFVPGEEPEKTLQKVVDFIGKYSKK